MTRRDLVLVYTGALYDALEGDPDLSISVEVTPRLLALRVRDKHRGLTVSRDLLWSDAHVARATWDPKLLACALVHALRVAG